MSKRKPAPSPEAKPKRAVGGQPKPDDAPRVEVQVSMGCTEAEKAGLIAEAKKIKCTFPSGAVRTISLSNYLRGRLGWRPIL